MTRHATVSRPWKPDRRDNVPGTVYLLHFHGKIADHAGHYIGWTSDIEGRLAQHRAGTGAKLMRAVHEAGLTFEVAGTWPGTKNDERRLKRRHNHGRYCPVCNGLDSQKVPWLPRPWRGRVAADQKR